MRIWYVDNNRFCKKSHSFLKVFLPSHLIQFMIDFLFNFYTKQMLENSVDTRFVPSRNQPTPCCVCCCCCYEQSSCCTILHRHCSRCQRTLSVSIMRNSFPPMTNCWLSRSHCYSHLTSSSAASLQLIIVSENHTKSLIWQKYFHFLLIRGKNTQMFHQ